MVEFEADDALAAADARVEQVVVCTPDKDLAQCVRGEHIVQLDRRTREVRDESAVGEEVRLRSNASARCCFGSWPRCVPTRPSAPTWTRCAGGTAR